METYHATVLHLHQPAGNLQKRLGTRKWKAQRLSDEAMWRLLRAETNRHLYWGEDWVPPCHHEPDQAVGRLQLARARNNQ